MPLNTVAYLAQTFGNYISRPFASNSFPVLGMTEKHQCGKQQV